MMKWYKINKRLIWKGWGLDIKVEPPCMKVVWVPSRSVYKMRASKPWRLILKKIQKKLKTVIGKTLTEIWECLTLIWIMSAQLLICKLAVFLFFTFFWPMACVTCMACWLARSLSRPTTSPRSGTDAEVENTVSKTYFIPTVSDLECAIAGLPQV